MKKNKLYTGGHKLRIAEFQHLETSYTELVKALAKGVGLKFGAYLLDGVSITVGPGPYRTVNEGWIFWNDEVFYVPQHIINEDEPLNTFNFHVIESVTPYPGYPDDPSGEVKYQDGTFKNVHVDRRLELRENIIPLVEGFPYSTLQKAGAIVPSKGIIMYSGSVQGFDQDGEGVGDLVGWHLCNGNSGTPDLRGRFIVGYADSNIGIVDPDGVLWDNEYQQIGNKSLNVLGSKGTNKVILNAEQSGLRQHGHSVTDPGHSHEYEKSNYSIPGTTYPGGTSPVTPGDENTSLETTGVTVNASPAQNATQSHENRPPWYVLAFIMKS